MDVIGLPTVYSRTSAASALDAMKRAGRRAVALRAGNDIRVVLEDDLERLSAEVELAKLGDRSGYSATVLTAEVVREYGLDCVDPWQTSRAYETMLDALRVDFAVFGVSPETALLVTRSESLARKISTGGYHCTGNPSHYFAGPTVSPGKPCPLGPGTIVPD